MNQYRDDFPILKCMNRGKPMVYLDSAASTQKPRAVVDAMSHFYYNDYANIHRGIYELSERATRIFESAREDVRRFINARHIEEIIFVRGTTEAINLVAESYGRTHFKTGDEVIVSAMEHHANIVPWVMRDLHLKVIPLLESGECDQAAYRQLFTSKTKLVALTHVSNVLGTINPVREMIQIAHAHGVPVLVDGAQAVPHFAVDVAALDCDFYAFSGHKMYGPTGTGVLYGKRAHLDAMPPYQGGGDMIETVSFDKVTFAKTPNKFEAGTPDIAGVVGLSAAIGYLEKIGMSSIAAHDAVLLADAEKKLSTIAGVRIIGCATKKVGVISFVIEGVHPHDVGTVLDHAGVMVRAGHHCAMPLMKRLGVHATVRASFGIYNDIAEVDALIAAIETAQKMFAGRCLHESA
ncbi:MAG: cysteine sulfinate desulfinase [Gammaproteobacteria bacterium RIFCSPHIGHO2_12_FULL_42_10]|nr:MAG: cysteine sulfinate desulfinase [Gammaproteobacteria bacterium RIFCSPHIGHO2_12_FULL_42_10]